METAVSEGGLYLDLCQCHRTEGDPRPKEEIFKDKREPKGHTNRGDRKCKSQERALRVKECTEKWQEGGRAR